MGTNGVKAQNARVDQASDESFPASDPPSWTLGPGAASPPLEHSEVMTPEPPPGSASHPARLAPTSATLMLGDPARAPRPALAPLRPDTLLAMSGGLATAASLVLSAVGQRRLARGLGQAGVALLMGAIFQRLGRLLGTAPAGG